MNSNTEMKWETRRWISLRSGAGLFNEQVHSTPPSSVAPVGWRPPGFGCTAWAPDCFITTELRVEIYFLCLCVELPAHALT